MSENKDEQVKNLFEGTMSLYNTIDIDTSGVENTYVDAETKIKEVLNGEEALYVPNTELSQMLFQFLNLGYGVCGIKYLDMIFNNKGIATTAVGCALEKLNENTELLNRYIERYGLLEDEGNKIEEKELKGISEN